MTTPLKPCPFCGGAGEWWERARDQVWIECANPQCGNKTMVWGGRQPVIAAWNRRALSARLEALEKAYKAHRAEFNHLADCPKCEEPMTNLCPEWERLATEVCGKADYALDNLGAA